MRSVSPWKSKRQGDASRLVENFPNLLVQRVDGTDVLASLEVMQRAVEYIRSGKGPALVHAKVIRPYSHSLSDDERLYRPDEERTSDSERDQSSCSAPISFTKV